MTVDYQSRANPGRHFEVGDVRGAPGRTPGPLPQRPQVGVIVDPDLESESLGHRRLRPHPHPAGQDGRRPHLAGGLVDRTREPHADPDHAVAIHRRLSEDVVDEPSGLGHPVLGAML